MARFMFVLVFCFVVVWTSGTVSGCYHRNYGNGATVCVCNVTHCDSIPAVDKTSKGVITTYLSSASGDRFTKGQVHFSKEAPKHGSPKAMVTLDRTKRYQKIVGFGGAFTDASGINIAKLPKEMQERLIADYYGPEGIEYTLGRIPIGGSDFSTRAYSYDDNPGDENLAKFALQQEDFNYKIPFLKMAKKVSQRNVSYFGSPWSSPAWMKNNNKINNGGVLIGKPGEKYYKIWAKYFVKFIEEYTKNQVPIWGITIENEPGAGFSNDYKWNSLGFNKTTERDFVKLDLGPELHKSGYTKDKLAVMIYDDQLPWMKDFVTTVLSDKEIEKYVSGIAFHWYLNQIANFSDLDTVHHQFPNYFLLATEACEEWKGHKEHVSLGNWATVNRYAIDILKDLNHFTTGWVDWNLALDLKGGPNWVGNFVDAPIIVNETSHEYYKQPFFYALGHFSKFLPPNSVRLHHEEKNIDTQKVLLTVFERPDKATVLTVLNTNNQTVDLQLHDPENGYLNLQLKAQSLKSYVWY